MGDKAWSFTDFWSGGCVRYLCPFRHHLFTDNISTNSIVVGLFFLIIPVLQLKGRYLRVRDIFWGAVACMRLRRSCDEFRSVTRFDDATMICFWAPGFLLVALMHDEWFYPVNAGNTRFHFVI
jgi:hypothetical protein